MMDIRKMRKDALLEYAIELETKLYAVKRENKGNQDNASELRKKLKRLEANEAAVMFAIDTQLRSEFPEMEIYHDQRRAGVDNVEIPEISKWWGFLRCLQDKLCEQDSNGIDHLMRY